ncbi:SDR family NAD(P)-dependent oxidoreductase [Novosphingobium cyanobacteriorum]|uniref:SDR family oxidoreductase n=1 Tax=Novosphingobium cyanobacteriorum TaxID=3024215 RepID=A0ABT6CLZ6_9SPHN|nr:SDR family oxidoreductase [Novosphingobium cyanobacteriorum]MDF8334941.1 SDR family oxidoreductase [Novosphingobium cyanobacteriorum]
MANFPDLSGRAVLITGASSGLGIEFARAAAAAGASVALAARRLDRLAALKAEIAAAGGKAVAVEMDVEDEASVSRGFDAAQAALGPIMSVIANAGMNQPASALGIAIEGFDHVVSVNLRGVFITAREAAKRMIAAGSPGSGAGRILFIGSVGSHRVLDKLVAYNTTKAGVLMMGKALAKEWALKGINVNTICPGWIKTELNTDWLESPAGEALIASFPRKRVMVPADLADMALFLLSDAARTITGGSFELDDGQSL